MNRPSCIRLATIVVCGLGLTGQLAAQTPPAQGSRPVVGAPAPPPPIAPEVISRNAEGGVTVRAVRIPEPLRVDGKLDEEIYTRVPAFGDFVQQDPQEGEAATEKTEAWLFFDARNIYVSARLWDSHPEREVANEMRRDSNSIIQNENFCVIFDTFHDKRNGLLFQLSRLGGLLDLQVTDERDRNADWNTVWDARTQGFDQGWTVEIVIPFKSLRFNPGENQTWGFNMRRIVRWKNEWSYLTRQPSFLGPRAILTVSLGATLVGLDVPSGGSNLEVKPYGISGLRTDRTAVPAVSNKGSGDFGFDAKYGLTKSLTADFTYNTDFAQVEDDQQQVNLTRFSLFFPEKRDFFLEGQGTFAFGGVGAVASNNSSTPVMFFSRRIGLTNGRPVPIRTGARLTGKQGKYAIGLLNIDAEEDVPSHTPATNFSVVRLKRDLFRRSNIGLLYTRRSHATVASGVGETFGVDALYSLSPSFNINAYYARTKTPGRTIEDTSYDAKLDYGSDRYGATFEHNLVEPNFNPEVGFLRRQDFRRTYGLLRFSPRPAASHMKAIRKFTYQGTVDYFETASGRLDTRESVGEFDIDFQNSDRIITQFTHNYEFIPQPFKIDPKVTVPVGAYNFESMMVAFTGGNQRKVAGQLSYEGGSLYEGTKHTLGYSSGRVEISPRLSFEPTFSLNWVTLPWGDFTSRVVSTRANLTMNPRMFVSALFQYNSSANALTSNVRLRWEYQPGSELFVVYSDGRDTVGSGYPHLLTRAFIVKINRLFRF